MAKQKSEIEQFAEVLVEKLHELVRSMTDPGYAMQKAIELSRGLPVWIRATFCQECMDKVRAIDPQTRPMPRDVIPAAQCVLCNKTTGLESMEIEDGDYTKLTRDRLDEFEKSKER